MTLGFTNDPQIDRILEWLLDYRMWAWGDQIEHIEGLTEGLIFGAALALHHPEWLQAFVQKACAAEDRDLEGLPDGHSWLEHCDVVDALVQERPL
jgi:hypothetical protein